MKRRAKASGMTGLRELHPARLLGLCKRSRLLRSVVLYDATDSTNLVAMEAGTAGAPEGTLFIADEQRVGRGRKGRKWSSVKGKSLTFSLLLHPGRPEEGLAVILALATIEALGPLVKDLCMKWPNDLLVHGKKVGGILAEAKGDAVVIGMGLNVNERRGEFPAEIAREAVSLRMAVGRELDRGRILCRIMGAFERLYERFGKEGFASFRREVERKLLSIGEEVTFETGEGILSGRVIGITDAGYLRLDVGGAERIFSSGDVTVRRSDRGCNPRAR